jgi:ribosomal protein S18 acetylase RimI-like enzyme
MTTFARQHIRPYRGPDDLGAVLAFAGACHARSDGCSSLHPGDIAHFMSNGLRGRDLERHVFLCEGSDGALQALALIYPGHDAAYNVLVHPDLRGAFERELVDRCEQTAWTASQASGSAQTTVGTEVMDCDTIRRDLLLARGYSPEEPPYLLNTIRQLDGSIPEPIVPPGLTLRSVAGEHEVEAVAAVHDSAFTPKWAGGAYLPVMRTPGYAIERELVVVAPDGRFAAFLVYWLDPLSRSGLFEPVGCHADFRRRGLTTALLYEGMRRMVARGMRTAIVNHHADNLAAVALYRSVGFQTVNTITDYRKPMT